MTRSREGKGRCVSLRPPATSLIASLVAAVAVVSGLGAGCGSVTAVNTGSGGAAGGGTGGSGTGDGGADVALTASQACDLTAAAVCDALELCASFMVRVLYGDKATCVARSALGCTGDQAVPGTTRTVDDIVACGQAVGAASCADLFASRFPDACRVKPGTRVNGTACGSDWQCQSTYCSKTGQCGVCAPKADLGGTCTVDGGCLSGMLCASSRCVTPGDTGASCNDNQPCRSDLYCPSATAGMCAAKVDAAGSCADTDRACDLTKGVACNPFTKVCDRVSVAKGGEACGIINAGLTVCVGLNPCRGVTLLQFTGVCASPAADGTACGTAADGTNCVPPAQCAMGICRLPSALCN
jgi:hypothetical protein